MNILRSLFLCLFFGCSQNTSLKAQEVATVTFVQAVQNTGVLKRGTSGELYRVSLQSTGVSVLNGFTLSLTAYSTDGQNLLDPRSVFEKVYVCVDDGSKMTLVDEFTTDSVGPSSGSRAMGININPENVILNNKPVDMVVCGLVTSYTPACRISALLVDYRFDAGSVVSNVAPLVSNVNYVNISTESNPGDLMISFRDGFQSTRNGRLILAEFSVENTTAGDVVVDNLSFGIPEELVKSLVWLRLLDTANKRFSREFSRPYVYQGAGRVDVRNLPALKPGKNTFKVQAWFRKKPTSGYLSMFPGDSDWFTLDGLPVGIKASSYHYLTRSVQTDPCQKGVPFFIARFKP